MCNLPTQKPSLSIINCDQTAHDKQDVKSLTTYGLHALHTTKCLKDDNVDNPLEDWIWNYDPKKFSSKIKGHAREPVVMLS